MTMYDTKIISLFTDFEEGIRQGARLLREGELVAFPTETVYGLGANALCPEAVSAIFAAKGRPGDNPLIVHVTSIEEAAKLAHLSEQAELLMETFWPGPLTIVLPKRRCVPYEVTAGLDTVALRMPDNQGALALISAAGVPVAAPSANASGRPSPTRAEHVFEDLRGKVELILDGGESDVGLESTVLSLAGEIPTVLRPGAITPEMLSRVLGEVQVSPKTLEPLGENEQAVSPGMKYKHYAPKANVTLVEGEGEEMAAAAAKLYDQAQKEGKKCLILSTTQTCGFYGERTYVIMGDRNDPITICHSLFALLRQADERGMDEVILEALPAQSLGLAYMNRALRAAGFHVVKPQNNKQL
jgi:L-threonylcarbamoyladenylate synthase